MKLYTKPGACSLADHIALIWSGLPFEVQIVDHATMKSPAYMAMNPAGAVPVLEDDGWVLTQNAAILHYICDKAPAAGLDGGSDPRTRAEVNRWLSFVNADVHPTFHPLFGSTAYLDDAGAIEKTKENARAKLRVVHAARGDAQLAANLDQLIHLIAAEHVRLADDVARVHDDHRIVLSRFEAIPGFHYIATPGHRTVVG